MSFSIPKRLSNGIFNAPSELVYSALDKQWMTAEIPAPLGCGVGFSVMRIQERCSGIRPLLNACSPSTILWSIVAIIINTVNRAVIWPISHISNKVMEGLKPSVAHFNASSPIPPVFLALAAIAPIKHVCVGIAERVFSDPSVPIPDTSAGLSVPTLDVAELDYLGSSAVAAKEPFGMLCAATSKLYRSQLAKLCTSYRMIFSHVVTSYNDMVRGLPVGAGSASYYTANMNEGVR